MKTPILTGIIPILLASTAYGQIQGYNVGQTVNDFTVTDTEGNTHNLYAITASGKHVVLDFFFDTCPPCQQTQPIYNQLHDVYGCNTADLFVISINNGSDSNAEVDAFEATYGGPYVHSPAVGIQGGCAAVDNAFNPAAYPTYCLIGPDNKLKNADIWPIQSMQTFVNAFPAGSDIDPAPCSAMSVAEVQAATSSAVFPIPSTGNVSLRIDLQRTAMVVAEMMDATGRVIHTEALGTLPAGTNTHMMDLNQLAAGNYLLRVHADGAPQTMHRLVLAR